MQAETLPPSPFQKLGLLSFLVFSAKSEVSILFFFLIFKKRFIYYIYVSTL